MERGFALQARLSEGEEEAIVAKQLVAMQEPPVALKIRKPIVALEPRDCRQESLLSFRRREVARLANADVTDCTRAQHRSNKANPLQSFVFEARG